MEKLEELLPGIEEFLTNTLSSETLSNFAEERRQYFVERLDIVNLPPSVPPREGRVLPLELLQETELSSGTPAGQGVPDFAATQRKISRSLIDHVIDENDSPGQKAVKVYDDIDQPERPCQDFTRRRSQSEHIPRRNIDPDNNDDSDDNENGLYEVPLSKQILVDDTSLSYAADGSSLATTERADELPQESQDPATVSTTGIPPPLPARRDRALSETPSRDSRGSVDGESDQPPELPYRPPLPKRNEIYARSEKSDKSETERSFASDPELSGDGDSTSYESFDEGHDLQDPDITSRCDVQLPNKPKKKTSLRRNGRLRKSKSPFQWEIDVPFKNLDAIDISGELFERGKLKWNRRIVAISNGHLVVYKPDRDARPSLVIPLSGWAATVHERDGRRGFEVRMVHADGDSHTFCLDLKDWAQLWTEHINGHAKGQPPPKYHTHLAGSFSDCGDFYYTPPAYGSKTDLTGYDANSPSDAGPDDAAEVRGKRKKVTRMGSFAFRATQFLENIGKKTSGRKKGSQSLASCRHSSGDTTDASSRSFHLQVSSSGSAGNLTRETVSPTSDSSLTSVFGDNMAASPPATPSDVSGSVGHPWETDSSTDSVEIACKSHLSIFSNFNKRCWGKRWCLVRGNVFECYKNEHSDQCELSFPLKACLLRRAVSETNSENGLMVLEADKEKITIEPLSKYDMEQWVRTLLKETSTEGVPEGLEVYLQETNSDDVPTPPVTGKPVFSHEYEDPEETLAEVALLKAHYQTQQGTSVPIKADQNANTVLGSIPLSRQVPDSIMLPYKYNQITDSGFYSVKETNSDSDSSCGNTCDHDKLEGGYSTAKSLDHHRSSTSQPTQKKIPETSENTAEECSFPHGPIHNNIRYATSSSYGLLASQPSTKSSSMSVDTAHSSTLSPSTIYHQQSRQLPTDFAIPGSANQSEIAVVPKQNPDPACIVTKSGIPRGSSQTVLAPSGEEYSVILKRSERASTSPISPVEPSDLSVASNLKPRTTQIHEAGKCIASDKHTVVDNSVDATKIPITNRITKSSYCDPVMPKTTMKTTAIVETTKKDNSEGPTSNISKLQQIYNSSRDQPPPLPRSPAPSLHRDFGAISKSIPTTRQKVETPASAPGVSYPSDKQTFASTPSRNEEQEIIPNLQESWIQLIRKPNTTIEELTSAIDSVKSKHIEIKRKRMAVHDKRQRVLSDEERLACEKEFAALEKLGETTDRTMRSLQNHLANMQGHTLGTEKTASTRHSLK